MARLFDGPPQRQSFRNPLGSGLKFSWRVPEQGHVRFHAETPPLLTRIDLIPGVGPVTEKRLRRAGIRSIQQLYDHPRFGPGARSVGEALRHRDVARLLAWGAKDVQLLPLFHREDVVVVDIETTGFSRTLPLFLIGLAVPKKGRGWEIHQFFAPGFEDEAALLFAVSHALTGKKVCVSYNGKAFDEPFVQARFRFFRLTPVYFPLHVDVMHTCRRRLRGICPDFRLTTVTQTLFRLERHDEVASHEVPDVYYRYMQEGGEEHLIPLLRHNAYDLAAVAWLFDAFSDFSSVSGEEKATDFRGEMIR